MKCQNCNYENLNSAKFCFNCGSAIVERPMTSYAVQLRNKVVNAIKSPLFLTAIILITIVSAFQLISIYESNDVEEVVFEIADEMEISYLADIYFSLSDYMFETQFDEFPDTPMVFVNLTGLMGLFPLVEMLYTILVVASLWIVFGFASSSKNNLSGVAVGFNMLKIGQIVICICNCIAALLRYGVAAVAVEKVVDPYKSMWFMGVVMSPEKIESALGVILFFLTAIYVTVNIIFTVCMSKSLRAATVVATTEYDSDVSRLLTIICYIYGGLLIASFWLNIFNVIKGVGIILFGIANKKFDEVSITSY